MAYGRMNDVMKRELVFFQIDVNPTRFPILPFLTVSSSTKTTISAEPTDGCSVVPF
ncbi:hypothetical protein [Spirosoma pomorum]